MKTLQVIMQSVWGKTENQVDQQSNTTRAVHNDQEGKRGHASVQNNRLDPPRWDNSQELMGKN
jgi:hypothetical protein